MRFSSYLESLETRQGEYLTRLRRFFPNQNPSFYQHHMNQMLSQEKNSPDTPDYNDPLFNQYIHRLQDEDIPTSADISDKSDYGTAYPYYQHGANQQKGNIWVKNSANPKNSDRILCCQFAAKSLYTHTPNYADDYYEKLYSKRKGYQKPEDFWEIPYWVAVISRNLQNVDFYVVRDLVEAIEFFNRAGYKEIVFSVMDVAKDKVKMIAHKYSGAIAIGGYSTSLAEEFSEFKNVHVFNSMEDFVLEQKHKAMEGGADYSLFRGTKTIPRLCMSTGCKHQCKFCDVSRRLEEVPTDTIMRDADAIASLKSKLVYINDKTFGQANNYKLLPQIFQEIRQKNKNFQGFIVQTTASAMASKRLADDFVKASGIKFIELGIETYNDEILRDQKKPATEKSIDLAVEKIRRIRQEGGDTQLIPNIIIGFPGETNETYNKTYNFLLKNKDIISHLNIYSLAVYDDTELKNQVSVQSAGDRDENQVAKSFHTDPKVHETWHKRFIELASQFLDHELDVAPQSTFADYLRQRAG